MNKFNQFIYENKLNADCFLNYSASIDNLMYSMNVLENTVNLNSLDTKMCQYFLNNGTELQHILEVILKRKKTQMLAMVLKDFPIKTQDCYSMSIKIAININNIFLIQQFLSYKYKVFFKYFLEYYGNDTLLTRIFKKINKNIDNETYLVFLNNLIHFLDVKDIANTNIEKTFYNNAKYYDNLMFVLINQNYFQKNIISEYIVNLVSNYKIKLIQNLQNNNQINKKYAKLILEITISKILGDYEVNINHFKHTSEKLYYINFVLKKTKEVLSEDEIRLIINDNISLNTCAAMKNGYIILKKLNKYINKTRYNVEDVKSFYPIQDAARYGSLDTFKYILKYSTHQTYMNHDYNISIFHLSMLNNDLRIFKYICNSDIINIIRNHGTSIVNNFVLNFSNMLLKVDDSSKRIFKIINILLDALPSLT